MNDRHRLIERVRKKRFRNDVYGYLDASLDSVIKLCASSGETADSTVRKWLQNSWGEKKTINQLRKKNKKVVVGENK